MVEYVLLLVESYPSYSTVLANVWNRVKISSRVSEFPSYDFGIMANNIV